MKVISPAVVTDMRFWFCANWSGGDQGGSLPHTPVITARRKKVQAFIDRTGFAGWSEVWSWDKKNKRFRIEKIS